MPLSESKDMVRGAFRYCPSCGAGGGAGSRAEGPAFLEGKRWYCASCGFEYFHNVAAAAGILLDFRGELVFLERAKKPRAGKLGLPGGFVDPGERAEDAALRECREEIGWAPPRLNFLGSFPNSYFYGGIGYNTCDLYFYYRFPEGAELPRFEPQVDEASAIVLVAPGTVDAESLAFVSLARAVEAYGELAHARMG